MFILIIFIIFVLTKQINKMKKYIDLLVSLELRYKNLNLETEWDNGVAYGLLLTINELRETLELPKYKRKYEKTKI